MTGVFRLLGKRTDIARLTAALDVATSSSAFGEAFPNVLGEAMSCAVPCVVTDVGDSAYIVGPTGRVVKPGQAEALAVALAEILKMEAVERRALGQSARERVSEMFELGAVRQRYEAVFLGLASPVQLKPCAA